jgi:hypothetical protein
MARPTFKTLDYLYMHTSGAGNTGQATIVTTKRQYVFTLAAATANSFQFVQPETVNRIILSTKCAAAGGIEVSRISTSQFANAGLATSDVLCRLEIEPVTTSGLPNETATFDFT